MLNSKDMKKNMMQLFAESSDKPYVVGSGIITSMKIGFDEKKLEASKQKIATILQEVGIDEQPYPLISLSRLTTLKNGEIWNHLQSIEDFQALELLLASSDACGFIHNDAGTIQRNIHEVGDINSILISSFGRNIIGDDNAWLEAIRGTVINKMYFFTDPKKIKASATGNQDVSEKPVQFHK